MEDSADFLAQNPMQQSQLSEDDDVNVANDSINTVGDLEEEEEAVLRLEPGQCVHQPKALVLEMGERLSGCSLRGDDGCCQCVCREGGRLEEECSGACSEQWQHLVLWHLLLLLMPI